MLSRSDLHSVRARKKKRRLVETERKEGQEILVLVSKLSNKVSVPTKLTDTPCSLVSWLYIG